MDWKQPTLGDKTGRIPTNETELIKSHKSLWNCDEKFSFRISAMELDTSKRNTFTMSDPSESTIVHLEHWSKISLLLGTTFTLNPANVLFTHPLGSIVNMNRSKSSLQACEQTSLFSILMVLKYLINFTYHRRWGVDLRLKVNSIRRYLRAPIILMSC